MSMLEGFCKRLNLAMTYMTRAFPKMEPKDERSPITEVAIAVNLISGFPDTSSIVKNRHVSYVRLDIVVIFCVKQVCDLKIRIDNIISLYIDLAI